MNTSRFLHIEPVGHYCIYCWRSTVQLQQPVLPHGRPGFMEMKLFGQILSNINHLDELQLQDMGEPLLHPQVFDMVAQAAQRGIRRKLEPDESRPVRIEPPRDPETALDFEVQRTAAR